MKKITLIIFGLSLCFLAQSVFADNETSTTNATSTEKSWKSHMDHKRSEVRKENRTGDMINFGNASNVSKEQHRIREEKRKEFLSQFNAENVSGGNITGVRDHGAGVGAGKGQGGMHRSERGTQKSGKKK